MSGIKTRCKNCRTKIEFKETFCEKCNQNIRKKRKEDASIRMKEADKYTKTSTWQSLRKEIIIRDKGCCVLCFIRKRIEYRGLQVHHIVKRVDDISLAYERDNLVTLCRSCHEEVEKLTPKEQRKLLNKEENIEKVNYLL